MKALCIAVTVVLTAVACSEQKDHLYPEQRSITQSVYASGVVVSSTQYLVYPVATGTLQRLLVSEGDSIVKGQPIAEVRNEVAGLTRDNARLAAEFAAVANNAERLAELKTAVQLAALKRTDDSLMAARQRRLLAQGVGSKVETEQRELAAASSRASHESAVQRFTQLEKQLRFSARQAKVQQGISDVALRDLVVTSAITGRVFSIMRNAGEAVNPQTPIAVLGSDSVFVIELQVDESDIASIRVGQQAYVTLDSYRDSVFTATVTKIHPMMNARTKSFTVEARFERAPQRLYANLTAEANIVLQTKEKAIIIPRDYVNKDGHVRLADGTLKKVELGIRDYQTIEVVRGLRTSDALVRP
jgi:HlyD family secretion protein